MAVFGMPDVREGVGSCVWAAAAPPVGLTDLRTLRRVVFTLNMIAGCVNIPYMNYVSPF